LHAQSQRNRIEFLKTDLAICFTFADLVDTEFLIGDREAALLVKEKAEHGYETIAHLLTGVDDSTEKDAIQERLHELRARLDGTNLVITLTSGPAF
jgi:hypothetical protein